MDNSSFEVKYKAETVVVLYTAFDTIARVLDLPISNWRVTFTDVDNMLEGHFKQIRIFNEEEGNYEQETS